MWTRLLLLSRKRYYKEKRTEQENNQISGSQVCLWWRVISFDKQLHVITGRKVQKKKHKSMFDLAK